MIQLALESNGNLACYNFFCPNFQKSALRVYVNFWTSWLVKTWTNWQKFSASSFEHQKRMMVDCCPDLSLLRGYSFLLVHNASLNIHRSGIQSSSNDLGSSEKKSWRRRVFGQGKLFDLFVWERVCLHAGLCYSTVLTRSLFPFFCIYLLRDG